MFDFTHLHIVAEMEPGRFKFFSSGSLKLVVLPGYFQSNRYHCGWAQGIFFPSSGHLAASVDILVYPNFGVCVCVLLTSVK